MTCSSVLLAAALAAAAAEPKLIKFATLAPEGSTWMKAINELNAELQAKTGGALKLKTYPGGVSGDERDVVKKVRIGQLHAAGFTGVGLGEIAPEVRVLDAPWLLRDAAEVDFITKGFDKQLSSAIEKAGYVLLGWTELGPVYVFTKNPIAAPEDLRRQKMWVWEGDPIAQAAYRALGVSPVPLSVVDVLSSLQTGLIDGVYGPPLGVIALQWSTRTKYIYAVPMAYATGAVLLSRKSFEELSPEQRKTLKAVAAAHLKRLNEASRAENEAALDALKKQGLTVTAKADAETLRRYDELGKTARRELAGKLYSAELLSAIEKALERHRIGKTKKS